jgi:hypothetical protein
MRIIASLGMGALLLLGTGRAPGQSVQLQAQVARAITRDLGISLQEKSARLAVQILGAEVRVPSEARLHVAAVHAVAGGDTWLLRMACGSREECLPFEVMLRGRTQIAVAGAGVGRASALPILSSPAGPPLVRAGERVMLAEEVSGMRLSAPAVCLQAGSAGQRIRVRNVSSRRVVLARVRAAGQVVVEE